MGSLVFYLTPEHLFSFLEEGDDYYSFVGIFTSETPDYELFYIYTGDFLLIKQEFLECSPDKIICLIDAESGCGI